eukprot:TRINITY_DN181_c1_g2_i1.p1 TRINITY_DN181_c1_g2~~TRINITY_DN181_c1_g2_i1.p1  ORF type:complete len:564 (-),score=235.09 TRINITY_DN181_c1_g2_i1:10-1701(-)
MQVTESVKDIRYDLQDSTQWEYLFKEQVNTKEDVDDDGSYVNSSSMFDLEGRVHRKGSLGLNAVSMEGMGSSSGGSNENNGMQPGEDGNEVLDLPPSWIADVELEISDEAFEKRCPDGHQVTYYNRCKYETFSPYLREDGMVTQIWLYDDDEYEYLTHVQQIFQLRMDLLATRDIYPPENRVIETFKPGREHSLHRHVFVEGEEERFEFYTEYRDDGLSVRTDFMGTKVVEIYVDRDDHLMYRCFTYDVSRYRERDEERMRRSRVFDMELEHTKVTEKFSRDPSKTADEDVAKRAFYRDDRMKVWFHRGDGNITASSRSYSMENGEWRTSIVKVDPFLKMPSAELLVNEIAELQEAEAKCLSDMRNMDRDIRGILKGRFSEEETINLEVSVYDIRRNLFTLTQDQIERKHQDDDKEIAEERDPLENYIWLVFKEKELQHQKQDIKPIPKWIQERKIINRELAQEIKDAALKGVKERLIEKANLIQKRLDEETQELARRQAGYSRNPENVDEEEEAEYVRYCHEAIFRIHILEQRFITHEAESVQKLKEWDRRLRMDSRLRDFL